MATPCSLYVVKRLKNLVYVLISLAGSMEAFLLHSTQSREPSSLLSKLSGPAIQPPRPHDNTYWVSENFLAGEYPTDARGEAETRVKLRRYIDLGIDSFLDLTHEGEKLFPYKAILKEEADEKGLKVEYKRFPIQDFGIPTKEQMKMILNYIDDAIERNKKPYVHCRGGIGRTGTTVGCFLVRHGNSGTESLEEVHRLFQSSGWCYESPSSPETGPQRTFVKEWQD